MHWPVIKVHGHKCGGVQVLLSSDVFISFVLFRFLMEKIDLVVVGAEGVAESGGIINKVCVCECVLSS